MYADGKMPEAGDRVRFSHPRNGYQGDQVMAAAHLKVREVYTLRGFEIGGWHTDLWFKEVPTEKRFNSVLFTLVARADEEVQPETAQRLITDEDGSYKETTVTIDLDGDVDAQLAWLRNAMGADNGDED